MLVEIQWVLICTFVVTMAIIIALEGILGTVVGYFMIVDCLTAINSGELRMLWYIIPWVMVGIIAAMTKLKN